MFSIITKIVNSAETVQRKLNGWEFQRVKVQSYWYVLTVCCEKIPTIWKFKIRFEKHSDELGINFFPNNNSVSWICLQPAGTQKNSYKKGLWANEEELYVTKFQIQ